MSVTFDPSATYGATSSSTAYSGSADSAAVQGTTAAEQADTDLTNDTEQAFTEILGENVPGMSLSQIDGAPVLGTMPQWSSQFADVREPGQPGIPAPGSGGQGAVTAGEAFQALLDMSPENLEQLQEELIKAGYLSPRNYSFVYGNVTDDSEDPTIDAFGHLLEQAINTNTSWQSLLNDRISSGVGKANWDYFQITGGQHEITKTITTQTSPLTAQEALLGAMTGSENGGSGAGLTGAAPSQSQLQQFTEALNQAEKANPETERGLFGPYDTTLSKNITEGSTQWTSYDVQQFAQNWVRQNMGAQVGAYKGATQYYGDALSVLGAGGGQMSRSPAVSGGAP